MPFFTSYPIISTRDKATPMFDRGEGLFVQYLLKTKPMTHSPMMLRLGPPAHIKICKVLITHIGNNLPCMDAPPLIPNPDLDNVVITYTDQTEKCGENATIDFKVEKC